LPTGQNFARELRGEKHVLSLEESAQLLEWVASGKNTREIKALAANCEKPFPVESKQISYLRDHYGINLTSRRRELEKEAMETGLSLRSNRLQALHDLARLLEDDIHRKDKLWLRRVKGIGSGSYYERVIEEEFNEAELRQLRGIYEDIAKEVGQRRLEFGLTEDDGQTPANALVSLPADMLASSFIDVYRDIRDRGHMEYLFKGGRGSTKSSFTSLVFIYLLMRNPSIHGIALRQIANTLRDSVYTQLVWAINVLGLEESFKCTVSPLEITYLPTNQKIYFRGADKPEKIKSIKPVFGYIGVLWFEELDQFMGQEAIRKIEQSILRGGDLAWEFKTYNPPKTAANWVNIYSQIPKPNQLIHHSNYLNVPADWLGKTFIEEAEFLKQVNPRAYEHEYMGTVTGTGGLVFENVIARSILDEEIAQFDQIGQGVDWGYFPDPFAWSKSHFDAARRTLYIFDEYKALKTGNKDTYTYLVENKGYEPDQLIIADSAEPKSIADYRDYGASCRGAEKGPESVNYSMKWLQSLNAIVIDPERCPEHLQEFLNYELEQDKDGEYISSYPDKNNHFIDAVRYRTNLLWRRRGV
jgi:phage terminase large subunit